VHAESVVLLQIGWKKVPLGQSACCLQGLHATSDSDDAGLSANVPLTHTETGLHDVRPTWSRAGG
jgi:hypothetical protein